MKIRSGINPALVISEDETRFVICHAQLIDGYLVSTDGRRIMVNAVTMEDGDDKSPALIHQDVLRSAFDAATFEVECDDISCPHYHSHKVQNDTEIGIGPEALTVEIGGMKAAVSREIDAKAKFPNWAQVVPSSRGPVKLLVNVTLLAELIEAMGGGDGQASLEFDPDDIKQPVVVTHLHRSDCFGLLMRLEEKKGPVNVPEAPNSAWEFAQQRKENEGGQP